MIDKIEFKDDILYLKLSGTLDFDSLLNTNNVYGDANFDNIKYYLIDLLDVTNHQLSTDDLKIKAANSQKAVSYNKDLVLIFVIKNQDIINIIQSFFDFINHDEIYWEWNIVSTFEEAYLLIN